MNAEIVDLESQILELQQKLDDARARAFPDEIRNYEFEDASGAVSLLDLFASRDDLIVIHNMGSHCAYCAAYGDGINGVAQHLESRAALAMVNSETPESQSRVAQERGWTIRMVSARANSFTRDLGFEPKPGDFWPGISAFHREGDVIVRTGFRSFDPGDAFSPIWPILRLLRDRGEGFEPQRLYPAG